MTPMDTAVWVIDRTGAPAGPDDVADALADLVRTARGRELADGPARTWAVLGDLDVGAQGPDGIDPDDPAGTGRAVAHDRIGRRAVRLAVDTTVSVGGSRWVRALHQGAVMEGSWGDEARLVADADAAWATLDAELAAGDVILLAGGGGELSRLARTLLDDQRCTALP
ncbi:UDP-N-acetylmuramoyl-tripeptide--D-alanyl-D-alanine ligase [Williamsia sp. SKLECPSW1]